MEEKILTLHPEGKNGVRISKQKYDQVKAVVLELIEEGGSISFKELTRVGKGILEKEGFDGSAMWYLTTVKLDLEARNIIE
ncbi:MAG: hypothetical protein AAF696_26025, partial [Bacteroidota bacterium]